jgi:Tol biopolymer transport system component
VISPDGSEEMRVGDDSVLGYWPSWSPEGSILCASGGGLYVLDPAGAEPRLIAEGAFFGAWSPDGARIAMVSEAPGSDGRSRFWIDVMRADGSDRTRITGP